jgi:serine/threonine protein kinase
VTKANINSKQLKFNEPPLNSLSSQVKELIGLMLERNYGKRISAEQALNHPWFSNSNNQKKLLKA